MAASIDRGRRPQRASRSGRPARSRALLLAAAIVLPAALPSGSARAQASFTILGEQAGALSFEPPSISADGTTVVGQAPTGNRPGEGEPLEAWIWRRDSGLRRLSELGSDAPDANAFTPRGISGDGTHVVGSLGDRAALWEPGIGTTLLPSLPGGLSLGSAHGISDDGRHVVGSASDGTFDQEIRFGPTGNVVVIDVPRVVPVRWALDSGTPLALSSERGTALDVDDTGVTVGTLALDVAGVATPVPAAFRWETGTGSQFVPTADEVSSTPWARSAPAISRDGSTVVGSTFAQPPAPSSLPVFEAAYLWRGEPGTGEFLPFEGMFVLERPDADAPRIDFVATGVSADGSVVVGRYERGARNDLGAFVWSADRGFRDLQVLLAAQGIDTSSWFSMAAHGVSADGRNIVGSGRFRNDAGRFAVGSWVAVIPEPSTGLLLGLGLGLLAATRSPTRR